MKVIKRSIPVLLALLFLLTAAPIMSFAAPGDTPDNPIIIRTAAELDNVRNGLDKYYRLGNDIDLTTYLAPSGAGHAKWGTAGWMPIGTFTSWSNNTNNFTGGFDGNNHKISGLWINRNSAYVGLFGFTSNATITNIGIEIAPIGINGYSSVGGLVGDDFNGIISNSYVTGNVSGSIWVGGLIGVQRSSIANCYTTGDIIGDSYVGGLVGFSYSSIINSYATGNVSGGGGGGLVGQLYSGASISNCYAMGNVSSSGSRLIGGLVGAQSNNSTITNSYRYQFAALTINGVPGSMDNSSDGIHGGIKTMNELLTKTTYTDNGWLFNDSVPVAGPWYWDGIGYPKLSLETITSVITITTHPVASTSVTQGNITGSLSIAASITPSASLFYQWYSNTTNSNVGGTAISGATTSSFTIPTGLTAGTYFYFCEIRATGATSVRSNVATVTVTTVQVPVITITTQSATNTTVTQGSITGSLSVAASVNPSTTLSYQWYSNTTNSNTGGTAISGATSASFTIPTNLTTTGSPYYYFCEVRATGATSVRSNVATVTVTTLQVPVINIITQPAPSTIAIEGSISGSLSVVANVTQSATLSYQWYSNTTNSNTGGTAIAGATNSSFAIPTTLTATGSPYYYFCEVSATGANSVRSNVATVTVLPRIISVTGITVTPNTATIEVGATRTLAANVTPENADDRSVTWSSSNTAVATVTQAGIVTAMSAGTAIVTARSNSNQAVMSTCVVTVEEERGCNVGFGYLMIILLSAMLFVLRRK
jgi:hypothetical protein